jgi:Alw26I/Eco31I/Esp3I family type II restriction m6 adenine DNA methyltransferase
MQKQEAINIIENTFNAAFTEERFTLFIKNLLNDVDTTKYNEYHGQFLKDSFKEHIRQYKRIGKYTDPNGDTLDILIVEVTDQTKLDKARTTLRNFVINHLDNFEKDYALAAFYSKSDNGADWRFSLVKLEYRTEVKEGKLKQSKELTPAKRYSFLVGVHEKAHTAKKQLLPLLENVYNNPTLEDLEEAFSIEKITDEFFEQYKALFLKLSEQFEHDTNGLKEQLSLAGIDIPRFTKKLLGQIVFLYFLQKKGWLGVPKKQKWGTGEKKYLQKLFNDAEENGKNFFGDYLQPLFYEALAHKHEDDGIKGYYKILGCKVPFLNGGLFEPDYKWEESHITIPNDLFRNDEKVNKTGDVGTGVLDIFDRYNFTIKEDEPLEKEVAVDPEMLGKVFENMLEITERKSKGAFYTPREIVHYMCQESLIHYLDNAVNSYAKTYRELGSKQTSLFGNAGKKGQQSLMQEQDNIIVPKDDIDTFIRKGFFALENDQRVLREGKETKTYKFQLPESIRLNADVLDEKLTDIKICDPAIGSGAFPVGLLHELVNAQLVLKQYHSKKYTVEKLKKLGVTNEEIEEQPEKYAYRVKRHTIKESIYGVDVDASAIDIARLRLWLSLVVDEDDLDNIEALPNLDYKIVCGNSLIGLPKNAMYDETLKSDLEKLKKDFFNETEEKNKKLLRNQINSKIRDLLDSAELWCNYKIDFDFELFFSEVWHYNRGFDIVIGNPPYGLLNKKQNQNFSIWVNAEHLDHFKNNEFYDSAKGGVINVFRLFITKSGSLLNSKGIFTEIFPLAYTGDITSCNIRKHTLEKFKILGIEAFPERDNENKRVFKHAKMSVCILIFSGLNPPTEKFYLRIHQDKFVDFRNESMSLTFDDIKTIDPENYTIPVLAFKDLRILKKIYKTTQRLSTLSNCYTGEIDLSLDKKYLRSDNSFNTLFKGAIIDRFEIRTKMSQGEIMFLDSTKYLNENHGPRSRHFQQQRIGMQGITGVNEKVRLKMTIIPKGYFLANSVNYLLIPESKANIKFILGQLNSEILNYVFKLSSTNSNVNGYEVNNLPIVVNSEFSHILGFLVDYLLELKGSFSSGGYKLIYMFYETLLNALNYELYFPTEIKSAGKEILKHLGDLEPINDSMSDEQKLAIIQSEFERLYDPNHPVRNNVETLDSVEEVRIIKEALK